MKKEIIQIKCNNCPYYTGIECHGHGEYYGGCLLIRQTKKMLSAFVDVSPYDIELKHYESSWAEVCDNDSCCKLFEIRKYV